MKPVIIFGTGDIAELAYFYFKNDSAYKISAFTVNGDYIVQSKFCSLDVIPFEEINKTHSSNDYNMFVAISYANVNKVRAEKFHQAKAKGYDLISYVSSKATTWPDLTIGENCFILEDNTIQPYVKIGNNVTLWSGNHIGHHSQIYDNCFLASHIVISGGVVVKDNTFIGVNATTRDHIVIEKNNVIAAGALINKNTLENGVYVGSPARLIKKSDELIKI